MSHDGIDRQADDMGEQRRAAIGIPRLESIPEVGQVFRQGLDPIFLPNADRLGRRAVVQPRRLRPKSDAFEIQFHAAIRAIMVEGFQRQDVQRRQEGDVRPLGQRHAKTQCPVCGQLGHQPVGDGRQAFVLLGFRHWRGGFGRNGSIVLVARRGALFRLRPDR